ncbi:MAG: hypothetical protein AAGJ81_01450 [Verrucomicrobiota bacterium]
MSEAVDRQMLRDLILIALHVARPTGFSADVLRRRLNAEGIPIEEKELSQELDYLLGKELCEKKASALSKANVRWHLTSAGVDYLEEEGLA